MDRFMLIEIKAFLRKWNRCGFEFTIADHDVVNDKGLLQIRKEVWANILHLPFIEADLERLARIGESLKVSQQIFR